MRILIITQKVDREDPILGFFHRWIEEFAKRFEKVTVICLERGEYDLPNIKVLSLGKETRNNKQDTNKFQFSKIQYTTKFFSHIWRERGNYDAVFVHMNQEYVLLAGLLWKLMGKKVYLWRNHAKGSFLTRVAVWLSDKVFYTSPSSFTARFKKAVMMPVGVVVAENMMAMIDTSSVLFLGRISKVKNVDLFIKSLLILHEKEVPFSARIVGVPANPEDGEYLKSLRELGKSLVDIHKLEFVPEGDLPSTIKEFSSNKVYVNLTRSGSMDKTILTAMASGCIVVIANNYFRDLLPQEFLVDENPETIANSIEVAINTDNYDREKYRKYVIDNHGIETLFGRFKQEVS